MDEWNIYKTKQVVNLEELLFATNGLYYIRHINCYNFNTRDFCWACRRKIPNTIWDAYTLIKKLTGEV